MRVLGERVSRHQSCADRLLTAPSVLWVKKGELSGFSTSESWPWDWDGKDIANAAKGRMELELQSNAFLPKRKKK